MARSQMGRQSVRHSPWHLNSWPRPPILPPHSGQIQFRMSDITSALALTVLHLINCITTSPIRKNDLLSLIQISVVTELNRKLLNAFPVPNVMKEFGEVFDRRMSPELKAQPGCELLHQINILAKCQELQSPSRSCLPQMRH